MFEVDLNYPEELHDLHSDYPLAPEKMTVKNEMLSPMQISMLIDIERQKLIIRGKNIIGPLPKPHLNISVEKLIPNLHPKKNYIVHQANLQVYQELGMQITKIHRVSIFMKSAWLKVYIEKTPNCVQIPQ